MKTSFFNSVLLFTSLALFVSGCATTRSTKTEPSPEEHARLLLNVANAALIENDPPGALEALARAEAIDPALPEIYHTRGLAFYNQGNTLGALEEVKKALKMAPDYVDANNSLGKILVDLGRYNEAVAPLLKAAHSPLYREAYKAWTNLGILYYRKGDLAKAGEYFERAIQQGGENACIAYYYRGHIKLHDAQYSEAIEDYKQATKKWCGGFADAHLAIGITYERTKEYELARRTFVEVESRYPNTKAADEAVNLLRTLP
jgi:Tfp pilus assembly protein PilF